MDLQTHNAPAFAVFGLLLSLSSLVQAQSELPSGVGGVVSRGQAREDTFETPRGIGMGLGGRASASGTSALAYNPANLVIGNMYHIEAYSSFVAGEGAWTAGSAVVDSISSKVAMGTSFRGVFDGGTRQYKGWDWRVAAGIALGKKISIGTGLRYARINAKRDSAGNKAGPRLRAITMDTGLTFAPHARVKVAAVAYNLINTRSPLAPRTVGGGVSLMPIKNLDLVFDVLADLNSFSKPEMIFGGGMEYVAGGSAVIRGGYRRDLGLDSHTVTGGIGYIHKKVGVESAFQRDTGESGETRILFTVRYKVQ